MSQKIQRPKFKTPTGTAIWPRLDEPDTRWKPEGEYRCTVRVKQDAPGVKKFLDDLQQVYDQHIAKWKADGKDKPKKGQKKPEVVAPPWKLVLDDNEDETGEVDIKCSLKAQIAPAGKPKYTQRPALFDAQGHPMKALRVGSGSQVRVAGVVNTWESPLGAGVQLWLKAVQVLKLVAPGADASYYGFEKEDGFDISEMSPAEPSAVDEDDSGSDSDDESGDY